MMKKRLRTLFALAGLLALLTMAGMALAQDGAAEMMDVPEAFHQMDWFIGEWEVASRYLISSDPEEWVEDSVVSSVQPIIGGYGLLETFDGTLGGDPLYGISLRRYNPDKEQWEQRWTDNQSNTYAHYTGEWMEDEGEFMAYSNASFTPEDEGGRGEDVGIREVFYDIEDDRFSYRLETTEDGGETWTVVWELEYTRVG